jgi:hypothetical protein
MMLVAWTPEVVLTVPAIEIVVVHACSGSAGTAWTHMEGWKKPCSRSPVHPIPTAPNVNPQADVAAEAGALPPRVTGATAKMPVSAVRVATRRLIRPEPCVRDPAKIEETRRRKCTLISFLLLWSNRIPRTTSPATY